MTPALQTAARRSLAPLALMVVIFILSAQPDLSSGLGVWDTILRKLIHMAEFGLLTLLWCWAFRPVTRHPLPIAVAVSLAYAISDEYHQTFVAGRHGAATDVLIDFVGIAVAAFVYRYDGRVRPPSKERQTRDRPASLPGGRRSARGTPRGAGRPR